MNRRRRAIKAGYRSGLEEDISIELIEKGVQFTYEKLKISWLDSKTRTYTPDFVLLDNGIIIESKGRFTSEDRRKHKEIKKQYPDLDLRFVFTNSEQSYTRTLRATTESGVLGMVFNMQTSLFLRSG